MGIDLLFPRIFCIFRNSLKTELSLFAAFVESRGHRALSVVYLTLCRADILHNRHVRRTAVRAAAAFDTAQNVELFALVQPLLSCKLREVIRHQVHRAAAHAAPAVYAVRLEPEAVLGGGGQYEYRRRALRDDPSLSHCAMPIIGPPLTIFLTSRLSPPQYSISRDTTCRSAQAGSSA